MEDGLKQLRKQLLAGGYYPLPGVDKTCRLKGWNGEFLARELTKYGSLSAAVDSWDRRYPDRRTTNVQVRDGLVVFDADIDDLDLANAFADILHDHAPDVFERAPVRYGSGEHKTAWFCRLAEDEELFVRHGSGKFTRQTDSEVIKCPICGINQNSPSPCEHPRRKPDYHHVEVFGGKRLRNDKVSRQFGCFGPHTAAKGSKPEVVYSWADGGSLADVPLIQLPVVTTKQIWEILEAFEQAAREKGWEAAIENAVEGGVLYDIDRDATKFETRDYGTVNYTELEELVSGGEEVRLWATFIAGEQQLTERNDRCQAMMSDKYHCVMVYDYKLCNTHLPADLKKPDLTDYAGDLQKLKARPAGAKAAPPPPPPSGAAGQPAGQINGPLTQHAVAQAFAEIHADQLRFCHHAGAWYEWDGRRWRRDEKQRAFQFCRELARTKSRSAPTVTEVKEIQRVAFAGGVERFAKGDFKLAVTSEHWDQDPWVVGTPEGTLELQSGRVRAARPGEGITKLMGCAPLSGLPTPIWDRFLMETFEGDLDLIRFNQAWFGYNLTGDVSEHALWFGYGSGGNGKGVLLNTIGAVMGDYAGAAPMETFTAKSFDSHPTELAMLRGLRMVTASETEEGRAWAESRIKQLTGGDPVTARFMHKDFFTYRPQFKLSLIGNHKPRLKNVDGAIRRRFRLVPFLNNVPKERQDPQLQEKLRAEWPGIAQWLVEGCLDWQRNGLIIPEAVRRATEGYFEEQDVMGQWLAEECEVNRNTVTAGAVLFLSWTRFATAAGHPPGARNVFVMELGRRGFERARDNSTRGVQGLKLKGTPNLQIVPPVPPEAKE